MPYKVEKVKGGYKVATKASGKLHSHHAQTKKKAMAQMRALYANEPKAKKKGK